MNSLIQGLQKIFRYFSNKTAVTESFSGRSVTYGELDALSGQIAARLLETGVKKGEIVPVLLPRGIDYIAAELGVMKAGCAYAPLLPEYPAERIEYIKQDCGCSLVVDESFVKDALKSEPLGEAVETSDEDIALLIYTSGSTGNPKGVIHTFYSLCDAVRRMKAQNKISENDITLSIITNSFALSVVEIFDALTSGAQLVILDNEERKDINFVKNAVSRFGATVLYINPNMLKQLNLRNTSLRVAQTVGERLSGFNTDEYQIINIYGASETFCALAFPVDKAYDNTPIGKNADGFEVYLLNEDGTKAADGQEGEICVSGALASGYYHLDQQTKEVFTENPFSSDERHRTLYHTNDMGKRLPDGNIVYVNRKDWMVKINGQRVELGEIEVRIVSDVENVEAAVVKAFENEYGMTYLVAYYQCKSGTTVSDGQIEAVLRQKLPAYMIPRYFVLLDKLPLNPNGKVDRKSLLPPEAASFKAEYAAPATALEKQLCAAFEEILKCGRVGVNDDFFALGGDSLLVMTLQTKCEIEELSTEVVFAEKTPKRMAERIEELRKNVQSKTAKDKAAASEYPLNPYERGVYLEQKLSPESLMYNLVGYYEIKGADAEQIRLTLQEVFRAHEAFHSVYREKDGAFLRVLTDEIPDIAITQINDIKDGYALAKSLNTPFDLSAGMPLRAAIYTDGSACLLAMIQHHILFDGGSDEPFIHELLERLNGKAVKADTYDLSGAADEDHEAEYAEGLARYRRMFADGVPVTELPLKASRPKVHPHSDTNYPFIIDGERLAALKLCAKEKKTTVFNLLLAALSMTTAKYTAAEDVVIGVPVNTRSGKSRNTIGMFVNTAPLRLKPAREKMLDAYIGELSRTVSEYIKETTCPFDRLVAEFVKTRDDSRSPLYDVGINYIPYHSEYTDEALTLKASYLLQPSGKDINLVMQAQQDKITCYAQYSSELFDSRLIENFVEQLLYTAERFSSEEPLTLREAMRLPLSQRKQLDAFSMSAHAEVPIRLMHRMFEQQAEKTPDKTALIACDGIYSFDELNRHMNIVAHNLIARGIKRGDSVVLLLPRRAYFFIAQFGVLKAGATYIPCDPEYPADRINHIITDSDASYIITTKEHLADYPAEKAIDIDGLLVGGSEQNPDVYVSENDLAYMIYTSGSTGKPKGVMLTHKGICNYFYPHPANSLFHLAKKVSDRIVGVTTVSFDMMLKEAVGFFINGKTLIFADEEQMNDPRALAELMLTYNVDSINATPSRLQQYMDYTPFREILSNCRLIMSGGEGYPMSLLENLKKVTQAQIFNTYGPTEITVSSNMANITNAKKITIGRPLLNYIEYIVDKYGDLAPFGVVGELYIGGPGVARGYKNLDEMTAKQFVTFKGERFYKSGDYAKFDSEGNVVILGRLDNQVKLRGLRIELGEIQGLLEKQPHIEQAVVIVRKLNGQENLCAYFTADTEINIDALKNELKKHLTHYMIPTAYLQMDKMPITPNGKTDIKALPEPIAVSSGEYVAPATESERYFCELFQKVLNMEKVGATDDFFEIGGTSLVVTSVVIDACEKGYQLSYGDVFKYTTPRELAKMIEGSADDDDVQKLIDFDDYDYTKINELLAQNTVAAYNEGTHRALGNILLTGAVGYMGAHVLARYLKEESGIAYCLVRKGKFKSPKDRIKKQLFYYFGAKYNDAVDARVEAFDGDITRYEAFEQFETLPIDTVFNCAANVKHFSSGTDIEDVNVGGAKNCIRLCLKKGARLIHFSTTSVGGVTEDKNAVISKKLDENSLYYGQKLNIKYTASKLWSEREVLEAVAEKGLDGKVIRVGTLAARQEDGEFQINFLTNNFMGRLRSYAMVGCFPYSLYNSSVRMGPIDKSAEAILRLSRTPKANCLFNAVNNHTLPLGDIIRDMVDSGIAVDFVEDKVFAARLEEAEKDPEKAAILSSMLAYQNMGHGKAIYQYDVDSELTTQILLRENFYWDASSTEYVYGFIRALRGLGFFDEDNFSR